MSGIRVGVIGVGHLGYHHARNYASLPGVSPGGVVDTDIRERARRPPAISASRVMERSGTAAAEWKRSLWSSLLQLHRPITLDLLRAGVDVLVEKPIAANIAEARELVGLSQRAKPADPSGRAYRAV